MIRKQTFYQKPTDASRVKQQIVTTYFGAWKNVLKTWRNRPELAYVDLFSGPGVYEDGDFSTPLLILEGALNDTYLVDKLTAVFNDGDAELAAQLRTNICALPGIERFRRPPQVHEHAVSDDAISLVPQTPTLLFADPWGYKGLSIDLIARVLAQPGSDCIFFFNYNRINAGLAWPGFAEPLDRVFGHDRAEKLRGTIQAMPPLKREEAITSEMGAALKEAGAHCALRFRFEFEGSAKTSHYLLFASKHPKGCEIMKNVMRNRSSARIQGLGSFEFVGAKPRADEQPCLPGFSFGPLDQLREDLAAKFAGRKLTFRQLLYEHEHDVAVETNYRDAVLQLEDAQIVTVERPKRTRMVKGKRPLQQDAVIIFKRGHGGTNGGEIEH